MFNKINKTISLLRKLRNNLLRAPLVTIYKSFTRLHLDYGDILYDQTFNNSFHERLQSIQYNAALAIAGAIRGTFREKLYQELGFESLQQRRWYRKLCLFYKIALFKKCILAFIRPSANSTFHCLSPNCLKLIARLRLGLSHLCFHKLSIAFKIH